MFKKLLITIVISLGLGALAIVPIATSQNDYVAGYVVLPLVLLIGVVCLILFIIAIILLAKENKVGLYFLLAVLLVPTGFVCTALMAKYFEVGAYREEPMVSFPPEISNIVLFNENVTNDQVNEFLDSTMSTKQGDKGSWPLPGVHGIGSWSQIEGHQAIEFSFFDSATQEQRDYVYTLVRSSPIVFKLLEDVPTKDYMPTPELPSNDNRPKKEIKISNTHLH